MNRKESLLVKVCKKYENDARLIAFSGTWFMTIGKSNPSERMKAKIKAELSQKNPS